MHGNLKMQIFRMEIERIRKVVEHHQKRHCKNVYVYYCFDLKMHMEAQDKTQKNKQSSFDGIPNRCCYEFDALCSIAFLDLVMLLLCFVIF